MHILFALLRCPSLGTAGAVVGTGHLDGAFWKWVEEGPKRGVVTRTFLLKQLRPHNRASSRVRPRLHTQLSEQLHSSPSATERSPSPPQRPLSTENDFWDKQTPRLLPRHCCFLDHVPPGQPGGPVGSWCGCIASLCSVLTRVRWCLPGSFLWCAHMQRWKTNGQLLFLGMVLSITYQKHRKPSTSHRPPQPGGQCGGKGGLQEKLVPVPSFS